MKLQRGQSFSERLQSVPRCLLQRNKSIRVEDLSLTSWEVEGVQRCLADDFSHVCMEMHWTRLLGFVLGTYVVVSFVFACLFFYTDGIGSLGGDIPPFMSHFEVCWWFATVNVVTAGFAAMVPVSSSAYVLSTVAHLVGLLLNALLLGVVVAKANLPSAKMVFSNVICVRTRNRVQQLMVRVGNARGNILFSPDIRFAYIHAVTTEEGETYFEDTLLQARVPAALKPAFTITHPVTRDSPLDGKSEADIVKERGFFLLIVSATDVETGQSLYARRMYFMKDFRFNHQFEDVISERGPPREQSAATAEGVEGFIRQTKVIDFYRFHNTTPLKAGQWQDGSEGKVCEGSRRFGILAPEMREEIQEKPRQPSRPIGQIQLNGITPEQDWKVDWESSPHKREAWKAERTHSAGDLADFRPSLEAFGLSHTRQRQRMRPSADKEPSFDSWTLRDPAPSHTR